MPHPAIILKTKKKYLDCTCKELLLYQCLTQLIKSVTIGNYLSRLHTIHDKSRRRFKHFHLISVSATCTRLTALWSLHESNGEWHRAKFIQLNSWVLTLDLNPIIEVHTIFQWSHPSSYGSKKCRINGSRTIVYTLHSPSTKQCWRAKNPQILYESLTFSQISE